METTSAAAPAGRPGVLPALGLAASSAHGIQRSGGPDVYALSRPATLFTGDFYAVTPRGDGTWFAIGDVTGHGLDSAIFMAMIQELLEERLAADETRSPAAAVAAIHRALAPELPVHRFVSLVLGHLSADGRLRLTNAGHPPPLLLQRDGILRVPAHGPILNAFVPPGWTETDFHLERGEKIALYTDGVSEASSPAGEELGTDGVARFLAASEGRDARAVVHALADEVGRFTEGAPLQDDLTVMVVGRRPRAW